MILFIIKGIAHSLLTGILLAAFVTVTCMIILKAESLIKKRINRRMEIRYNETDSFRFVNASQSQLNNFSKKKFR